MEIHQPKTIQRIMEMNGNELNATLDNIKGNNSYVIFSIGDFNAKNLLGGGKILITPVKLSQISQPHRDSMKLSINQPIFIPAKIPFALIRFSVRKQI